MSWHDHINAREGLSTHGLNRQDLAVPFQGLSGRTRRGQQGELTDGERPLLEQGQQLLADGTRRPKNGDMQGTAG